MYLPEPFSSLKMADLALHLDAVGTFVQQLKGTSAVPDVLSQQKVHFQQALESSSLSIVEAERVCAALRRIPWARGDLDELLGLVAKKSLQGGPSVAGKCKLQDFRMLMHYFSHEQWQLLTNDKAHNDSKLEVIVTQASLLGLRHPSETTVQAMTAFFMASAQGFQQATSVLPSVKYQTNQHVKKMIKKSSGSPVCSWVPSLDREPSIFREKHPELYAHAFAKFPPAECPLDIVQLGSLAASIPARSTHKSISGQLQGSDGQSVGVMQCMMAAFQQMAQQQMSGAASSAHPQTLPITFLGPNPRQAQRPQLALPGPATPPRPANSGSPATLGGDGDGDGEGEGDGDGEGEEEAEQAMVKQPKGKSKSKGKKRKARLSLEESHRLILKQMETRDAGKKGKKAKASGKEDRDAGKKGDAEGKKTRDAGKKSEASGKKTRDAGKKGEASKKETRDAGKEGKIKLPTFGMEWSRSQVMCRAIDGTCFGIKFEKAGGHTKAVKEAQAWLELEKRKLGN